jgi:hypothetical protein
MKSLRFVMVIMRGADLSTKQPPRQMGIIQGLLIIRRRDFIFVIVFDGGRW